MLKLLTVLFLVLLNGFFVASGSRGMDKLSAIPRQLTPHATAVHFPRKKTHASPPMVGMPMQFPQCAMPETTPANKGRLCAMTDDE